MGRKSYDIVYIIGSKVFNDFGKAIEYSDKNPDKKLFSAKIIRQVEKYERIVTVEDRTPKQGLVFTDEEHKFLMDGINIRYMVILNKVNYNDRNYMYLYYSTPSYSAAFVNLFKYNDCFALEDSNVKFKTLDEFIDYVNKNGK